MDIFVCVFRLGGFRFRAVAVCARQGRAAARLQTKHRSRPIRRQAAYGPKNGPQMVSKWFKMVPEWSQNGPKMVSKWSQIVSKWSQNGMEPALL